VGGDSGLYAWSVTPSGRILTVSGVRDDCAPRLATVPGTWWKMGCLDPQDNCLGLLDPGTYKSQFITPRLDTNAPWNPEFGAITYTVPDGWANFADWPSAFGLKPAAEYATNTQPDQPFHEITVFRNPVYSSQDAACSATNQPGVGRTPDDVIGALAKQRSLTVGPPGSLTIGGHRARYIDVRLASTWKQSCPDASGDLVAPVLREDSGNADSWDFRVATNERVRVILVDLGSNDVLAILLDDSTSQARFDELVAASIPVIETFEFE
jgi:hypothetical protein